MAKGVDKSKEAVASKCGNIHAQARKAMQKTGIMKHLTNRTGGATTKSVLESHKTLMDDIVNANCWFTLYWRIWQDDPKIELKSTDIGMSDSDSGENGRAKRSSRPKVAYSPDNGEF